MWRGDIGIKGFINIDHQHFIQAKRWQRHYDLDDLSYDTPESRQICDIYNIENIFDLRFLFGL